MEKCLTTETKRKIGKLLKNNNVKQNREILLTIQQERNSSTFEVGFLDEFNFFNLLYSIQLDGSGSSEETFNLLKKIREEVSKYLNNKKYCVKIYDILNNESKEE